MALAAAALGGCGGGGAAEPPAAPSEYFVGRAPAGDLGAAVDFRGADPAASALRQALAEHGGGAVAVVAVVNDGTAAAPVPRFTAVAAGGAQVPLVPARRALAGRGDPAARRVFAHLPPERRAIAGEGSALLYVVLRGRTPREVRAVLMRPSSGEPVVLEERPR